MVMSVRPAGARRGSLGARAGGAAAAGQADVTSILLVEEYPLVRRGTRLTLEADPQLEVCGDVSTVAEAIEGAWDPDLVVHALLLPDASGPQVVARLRERFPRARLLALARLDNPVYVHLALTAGDAGYVSLKSAAPGELLEAVRRVAAGEDYVQPALGAALARWEEIPRRHDRDSLLSLTRREQEVLELLALGYTNAEVAAALGVALRTVEAHRTHVTQKLGLHSRADLVRFVAEQPRSEPPA
jgi:two-component system, NarL family, response regulator NreC